PWQVPIGYLFLLILVGLVIRDKLYLLLTPLSKWRALAVWIAALIAAVLIIAYLRSSWDDLKLMAQTIYPGHRRTNGGDRPLWRPFAGVYNLGTVYNGFYEFIRGVKFPINQSEAASFYLLFPALIPLLALSRKCRESFGLTAWLIAAYLVFMLIFYKVGLPDWTARLTLFNRVTSDRLVIVIGLASIIVCLRAAQCAKKLWGAGMGGREKTIAILSAATMAGIFCLCGLLLAAANGGNPPAQFIVFASLMGGYASYCLAAGRVRAFCAVIGIALVATVITFNPLSTNLDYIYESELAHQIVRLNKAADRPLWICYGDDGYGGYGGVLVSTLGGRVVSGITWPPPMDFWHELDPSRKYESIYNNYTHVFLHYSNDQTVTISSPRFVVLDLKISPDNSVLTKMGAKYILAMDESAAEVDTSRFPLVYKSNSGEFSIFEIP
ncbi:MAG: DUF7657 domain-containing protein, partial [Blastocatellia bacterium]